MIDMKGAIEAYNGGNIFDIIWIIIEHTLADAMTKPTEKPKLIQPLKLGELHYEISYYIKTEIEIEQKVNVCVRIWGDGRK